MFCRSFCFLLLLTCLSWNAFGQYWMQKGGSLTVDEAYDVAVDGSGNAYATGYFTGNATFGGTTLTSSGSSDIFVVKINNDGSYDWAVKAGGSNTDRGLSIDVDGSGNVYVTGFFNGSATFGATNVSSSGLQDVFVAKYSSAGALQWVSTAGGSDADIGNGIAVDNSGNVLVTGEFKGTSNFGATSLTSQNASTDAFVSKLDGSGGFLWTKQGAGDFGDRGLDVDVDNSGNVYATGQFSDTFAFDNTINNTMFNAIYVVKFNSGGSEQWFRMAGGASFNIANAIAVTGSGSAYITGDFTGDLTFFGNPNTALTNSYANGVFVTKYTSSGAISWARKSGSNSEITSQGIDLDNSDNAYIAGNFKCAFDEYTEEYGDAILNSVGYKDLYISKFTAGGTWDWAKQAGSRQDDLGWGIGVSGSGQAHIAGAFKSTLFVPTSSNFESSNLALWNAIACSQNNPYCGDPDYGDFHSMESDGNFDAVIANCFDPNREPYDYYQRSGSGCVRDIVKGCINNGCPDTVSNCNAAIVTAIPKVCTNIGPTINYAWSNNQNISQTFYSNAGYAWVDFKTADQCFVHRDSIYINIFPGPPKPLVIDDKGVNAVPTQSPLKVEVCIPDTAVLTASGFTVDSFYWSGPTYPGQNIEQTTIPVWVTGTYTFTVVDEEGCSKSTAIDVEFYDPLDPFILKADVDDTITICDNEDFRITLYDSIDNPNALPLCLTDSQPTIASTMVFNPSWPAFVTCHTLIDVQPMDTGWFHFDITLYRIIPCDTDTFRVVDSVYVIPLPSPEVGSFSIQINGSDYFCPGESVQQYATGSNNYIWSGPNVGGVTNDTITASTAGTYSISSIVYDTNAFGCMDSSTATASKQILQKPQPQVSSNTLLICPGDSVWLTVTNSGATEGFFWEGPNGVIQSDSNTIAVSNPGTYYCTINDSDSCDLSSNTVELVQYNTPSLVGGGDLIICDGDSLTLNVISSAGSEIQWLPPLTGTGPSQTVYQPGVYTCEVTSCGITSTVSIEVFPSYVESVITPSGVLCLDSHIVLYGSPGMDSYTWSSSGLDQDSIVITQPGTYILTTTDSNGCEKVSDPVTIEILQEPTVIGLDGYPVFCFDDSITLYGNENMVNYLWFPTLETTSTITSTEEGTFALQTIDSNGCRGVSEPLKVTIPDTAVSFTIDGQLEFCEGDSVSFRAVKAGKAHYYWMPDSSDGRTMIFDSKGTYQLVTVDTFGCEARSEKVDVYVQPFEVEEPIVADTLICIGDVASLNASVNIGNLYWAEKPYGQPFNEGELYETVPLSNHVTYYLWSDHLLCRGDTTEVNVFVQDCYTAFTPNIFTPNADGMNDIFRLQLNEITCLDITVYNRWGVPMYEGHGIDSGWDGYNHAKGIAAEEGTYYYIANYCRHDGFTGTKMGYVTLIRE